MRIRPFLSLFFFNDTATTEIYTLSLHDALPICRLQAARRGHHDLLHHGLRDAHRVDRVDSRSEEHTSELQSQSNLVCRLLLEKKKKHPNYTPTTQALPPTTKTLPASHPGCSSTT